MLVIYFVKLLSSLTCHINDWVENKFLQKRVFDGVLKKHVGANHHYLYRLFRGTDHVFNLINVFFLMSISFLPFPTAVLADFMRETDNQQTAVMFYALGMLLPAFFWFMAWLYASRGDRLLDPNLDAHFVRYLTRQFLVSNVLYLGAVIVAFFNPVAGLAVCTVLTLLYLLPPRTPVYRPDTGTFREAGDD